MTVVPLVLAHRVYIPLARGHARTQLLYRFVERTGIDLYQGYGLARPMPPHEVLAWLDRRRDIFTSRPTTVARLPHLVLAEPASMGLPLSR